MPAANPALHDDAIVQYLNAGGPRPLDDLVERLVDTLDDKRLIRIDGRSAGVALFVIVKTFAYRGDILEDLRVEPPRTYDDMLAAAETVREAGGVEFPLAMTCHGDRDPATVVEDLCAAHGGRLAGGAQRPMPNSEAGMKSLETLHRTTGYLISHSTVVQQQLRHGKATMAILWTSRAATIRSGAGSSTGSRDRPRRSRTRTGCRRRCST